MTKKTNLYLDGMLNRSIEDINAMHDDICFKIRILRGAIHNRVSALLMDTSDTNKISIHLELEVTNDGMPTYSCYSPVVETIWQTPSEGIICICMDGTDYEFDDMNVHEQLQVLKALENKLSNND